VGERALIEGFSLIREVSGSVVVEGRGFCAILFIGFSVFGHDYRDEAMIYYGVVARGRIVLAEHSTVSGGNFVEVAHRLLQKIDPEKDARMTYTSEEYTFNYIVRDEMTFLCMADKETSPSVHFTFLEKLSSEFDEHYGGRSVAVPYSIQEHFGPIIGKMAQFFSSEGIDKFKEVQKNFDNVKSVMQKNIKMVLTGNEKLEHLTVQSENLMDTSANFRTGATRLKDKAWWEDFKLKLFLAFGAAFVIFLLIVTACGGFYFQDC